MEAQGKNGSLCVYVCVFSFKHIRPFWQDKVSQFNAVTNVVMLPPAGLLNEHIYNVDETDKPRTHHYEFYGDGQRQLFSVAGIDFFNHDEKSKCQNTDNKLWYFSLRQQPTNIHQTLSGQKWWREGEKRGWYL